MGIRILFLRTFNFRCSVYRQKSFNSKNSQSTITALVILIHRCILTYDGLIAHKFKILLCACKPWLLYKLILLHFSIEFSKISHCWTQIHTYCRISNNSYTLLIHIRTPIFWVKMLIFVYSNSFVYVKMKLLFLMFVQQNRKHNDTSQKHMMTWRFRRPEMWMNLFFVCWSYSHAQRQKSSELFMFSR